MTSVLPEAPLQLRDGLTERAHALQEEAAQQAEKDWETLDSAERRIFEDIAKGEYMVCLATPLNPNACYALHCFRHPLQNLWPVKRAQNFL